MIAGDVFAVGMTAYFVFGAYLNVFGKLLLIALAVLYYKQHPLTEMYHPDMIKGFFHNMAKLT